MKCFSRGSIWRKWDLHVHTPDTKLSNNYVAKDGKVDWERFCDIIHKSDVYGLGITDYFCVDGYFAFIDKYKSLYPECEKVFFPCVELRLNEAVNGTTEMVDFHIIFNPDLTAEQAKEFLGSLKTQNTDSSGKKQSCSTLKTNEEFSQATVSRADIEKALTDTFGKEPIWRDNVLMVAAANNNGIRADKKSKRKMNIADQIDKRADAFFGTQQNVEYFLRSDRYEDAQQKSLPKPVFSGCDAHGFDDLEAWLGKEINDGKNSKCVTWVKADLTYEGLQQTLIEPEERVKIQSTIPDAKEPYRVISKIVFENQPDFPEEVVFNPGLNAIIGSRSSGKSSLLAYISHAINPDYTVQQQVAATGNKANEVGPGASITWGDVKDIKYRVEWVAPEVTCGQVIYIPQNSLFAISERPDDITAKIRPVIFRKDPKFENKFNKALTDIESKNDELRIAVSEWFSLDSDVKEISNERRGIGDRSAIEKRKQELSDNIKTLRESSSLTSQEVAAYQTITDSLNANNLRLQGIDEERQDLSPYVCKNEASGEYETERLSVTVSITPSPVNLPTLLREKLQKKIDETRLALLSDVASELKGYYASLDGSYKEIAEANQKIKEENQDLIDKNVANAQISSLLKSFNEQETALSKIDGKSKIIEEKISAQKETIAHIQIYIEERDEILHKLVEDFNGAKYKLESVSFIMEVDYNSDVVERASLGFNKATLSPFINNGIIDLNTVLSDSSAFIEYMASGKQKLNRGENVIDITKSVLNILKEIRFVAEMESDRIGGFTRSSMTPGKQALFALTLILADSDELWPLLIDQPEDDLDSRSICDVIVKDLMKRKRERQIIMVTHNANLAIGADSEEILVANRHGDDRQNMDQKMFAYLTGSLEYSKRVNHSEKIILASAGIREHACEILDGGADAFQKRKDKYRI